MSLRARSSLPALWHRGHRAAIPPRALILQRSSPSRLLLTIWEELAGDRLRHPRRPSEGPILDIFAHNAHQ